MYQQKANERLVRNATDSLESAAVGGAGGGRRDAMRRPSSLGITLRDFDSYAGAGYTWYAYNISNMHHPPKTDGAAYIRVCGFFASRERAVKYQTRYNEYTDSDGRRMPSPCYIAPLVAWTCVADSPEEVVDSDFIVDWARSLLAEHATFQQTRVEFMNQRSRDDTERYSMLKNSIFAKEHMHDDEMSEGETDEGKRGEEPVENSKDSEFVDVDMFPVELRDVSVGYFYMNILKDMKCMEAVDGVPRRKRKDGVAVPCRSLVRLLPILHRDVGTAKETVQPLLKKIQDHHMFLSELYVWQPVSHVSHHNLMYAMADKEQQKLVDRIMEERADIEATKALGEGAVIHDLSEIALPDPLAETKTES